MALVVFDRVQETTATTGTGTITLGGAVTGYQSFAVVGDGNTTFYCITNGAQWEVGIGTYTSSGTTLSRDTILSNSNSNASPITLSGSSVVFVTYPAEKSVNLTAGDAVILPGNLFVENGFLFAPVILGGGSTPAISNQVTLQGGFGAKLVSLEDGIVTIATGTTGSIEKEFIFDINGNLSVNRLNQTNTNTTAAGGTTALTTASSYIHTLVDTGNQTYTMPDATTLATGVAFLFNNRATGTLTIQDYATGAIGTITAGGAAAVFLTSNATVGGTWDLHAYLPEGVTFGTNAFNLGTAIVSGGTWQGGTIQPAYGGTGLTTFTAANNALFSTSASALTAGTLPILAGGTGATTDSGARTNLGLGTIATQNANAVAITGGSINGTTIGASTASTGAFTTLLATGVTTVQAGTVSDPAITTTGDTNTGIFFPAADTIAFTEGGNEAMRITSASFVGIGTTNPAAALDVSGNIFTNGYLRATADGTAASPSIQPGNDADTGFYRPGANIIGFTTAGVDRMQIDASGLVGIGKTPSGYQLDIDAGSNLAIQSTQTGLTCQNIVSTDASASGMNIQYYKDSASPLAGDSIALVRSFGNSSTGALTEYSRITTLATVVTNGSEDGELRLSTMDNGAIFSAMRLLNSAQAFIPAVYTSTTASAANVFVASSGLMSRSTSSIQYKKDVEDLAQPNSANIYNMRPVWYRSTCTDDNKDWSYYGLIAEEVADIDPRLVHWGYANDQYDITYIENDGQKEEVKTLKEDAVLQPEGVQYDRLTVLLIQEMKALKAQVEAQALEIQALKAG
jgi:hypothetical protein